jgi:hypothetical protein
VSIARQFDDPQGAIIVNCDECGEGFESDTADFHMAIRLFKRADGQVRYDRGDYTHVCSDCVDTEVEDDFEDLP